MWISSVADSYSSSCALLLAQLVLCENAGHSDIRLSLPRTRFSKQSSCHTKDSPHLEVLQLLSGLDYFVDHQFKLNCWKVSDRSHIAFRIKIEDARVLTKDVKIDQSEGVSGSGILEEAFVKNVPRHSLFCSPHSPWLFFSLVVLCAVPHYSNTWNRLQSYISWFPDPFALGTDAFQITWTKVPCRQPLLLSPLSNLLLSPNLQPHPVVLQGHLSLATWKVTGKTCL